MFSFRLIALLILGSVAFSAHGTITTNAWVPIFKGVHLNRGEADTNEVRQQKVFALRIDLSEPEVKMFSTPSGGPLETLGQTTTTFVHSSGVAVGVNANFFSPVSTTPDDPRNLSGLAISEGMVVSPPGDGRPMLLVTRSNLASIVATAPASLSNVWTAVAGSHRILIDGAAQLEECDTSFCNDNPRTAVGISNNGRYLYLILIDGRRAGWSDGATLFETGEWLRRFGAWQGLNLDGGGSSAMAKLEDGAAVLVNRPSGGVQRVNGNHLGVFAPPIAPVILTEPEDQTSNAGSNVTFTVSAGGTTSLHYQWQFNGTNISGATNTSLTLTNIGIANRGDYSLLVSNLVGVAVSSKAVLTVVIPLEIKNLKIVPRPTSASIHWTSDPETISRIEYGIEPDFGKVAPLEPSARINHKFLLEGLSPANQYNFRIISNVDGEEIVSGPYSFSTNPHFIVDNPEATYSGVWTLATIASDKFGAYYQYATTTTGAATAESRFTPALLFPGKYDVSIWYPQGANRTANAPVLLVSNGSFSNVSVNQKTGGGAWRLLAPAVHCDPSGQNFARLGNNTGESNAIVVADAMRWSYVLSQDFPTDGSVPAWWSEFYFGTNANVSLDPDGDGYSTHSEFVIGTDPTDANSHLRLFNQRTSTGLNIRFEPHLAGRVYQLQSSTNLGGLWTTLPSSVVITNGQGTFSVTNSGPVVSQFYRLSVQLAL